METDRSAPPSWPLWTDSSHDALNHLDELLVVATTLAASIAALAALAAPAAAAPVAPTLSQPHITPDALLTRKPESGPGGPLRDRS